MDLPTKEDIAKVTQMFNIGAMTLDGTHMIQTHTLALATLTFLSQTTQSKQTNAFDLLLI